MANIVSAFYIGRFNCLNIQIQTETSTQMYTTFSNNNKNATN